MTTTAITCTTCGSDDFREGCPFCGRTITDDGNVCLTCRETVEPMRFCATCGDEWPEAPSTSPTTEHP